MWGPVSDRLSRLGAVGLPSHAGGKTNKKSQQDAGEGRQDDLAEQRPHSRDQVRRVYGKKRLVRRLGRPSAFSEIGGSKAGIHRRIPPGSPGDDSSQPVSI